VTRGIHCYWLLLIAMGASAGSGDKAKVSDLAERALQQSQITLTGCRPFHLQAALVETTNPKSEYQAKIEEFWVSPTKWRRTIESPGLSQTLVVNGDRVFERNSGDYYPWWLNTFVTAIFDPLSPMLEALKRSNAEAPTQSGGNGQNCSDLRLRTDRWMICYEASHGLLSSVFMKGYSAEFRDYKKFGDKHVARIIEDDPEPGTHLQAKIVTLTELTQPDEQMFAIAEPTSPVDRIKTVRIEEDMVRKIAATDTEITWPSIGEGPATGGCAVYISADRKGRVREVWPGGCDNGGLQDSLREQVRKWKLNPAVANGVPVQINALVTFTFHATQDQAKALPTLSDAEVRKLAFYTVAPTFPPGTSEKLTEVTLNISLDENGKLTGAGPASEMPNDVFL
jgi:hypothetical protein